MPEPLSPRLRLIDMMRSVSLPCAACLVAALVLAGCGSVEQTGEGSGKEAPQVSDRVGDCAADSPAVTGAQRIAGADLDGDGTPEDVKLTAADGDCPNVVFAKVGEGVLAAQVPTDGPPVRSAFGVSLPAVEGDLLVTRQEHPRGGFQLRLFVAGDDALTELEKDGRPLLAFVATDVQEHPTSVDCSEGGFTVTEAVAHEPAGVVFAWDIKRTPYVVESGAVTAGTTEEVADNVLPAQLEQKYPELADYTMFRSCRTGGSVS